MISKWVSIGALVLCMGAFGQDAPVSASPNAFPMKPEEMRAIEKEIARLDAELQNEIGQRNKRPRKTYISPSTNSVGYAMYYLKFRRRVEEIGSAEFPKLDGKSLYGRVILSVPISTDGTIFVKDGGAQIERSSGNRALDDAALGIVQRAAPFDKLPESMISPEKNDIWVVVTEFNFTRGEALE